LSLWFPSAARPISTPGNEGAAVDDDEAQAAKDLLNAQIKT